MDSADKEVIDAKEHNRKGLTALPNKDVVSQEIIHDVAPTFEVQDEPSPQDKATAQPEVAQPVQKNKITGTTTRSKNKRKK